MRALVREAREQGHGVLVKAGPYMGSTAEQLGEMARLGAKPLVLRRRNTLSQLVCEVRDCLWRSVDGPHYGGDSGAGAPKGAAWFKLVGGHAHACLQRRALPADQQAQVEFLSAYLRMCPGPRCALTRAIHRLERKVDETVAQAVDAGYQRADVPVVDIEDCYAFEDGTQAGMQRAVDVWTSLLRSLGVAAVDAGRVRDSLENGQEWSVRESAGKLLEEAISNPDEVRAVLDREGAPYDGYFDG
jgi:hypothetical protein